MSELIKIFKITGLTALTVILCGVLGGVIDKYVEFSWLTTIFAIIRYLLGCMNWIINAPVLITCIGLTFVLDIGENAFDAGMIPVSWFKGKN